MSEPYETRKKISMDRAYELAWEWWDNLPQPTIEQQILTLWMKSNDITWDMIDN